MALGQEKRGEEFVDLLEGGINFHQGLERVGGDHHELEDEGRSEEEDEGDELEGIERGALDTVAAGVVPEGAAEALGGEKAASRPQPKPMPVKMTRRDRRVAAARSRRLPSRLTTRRPSSHLPGVVAKWWRRMASKTNHGT